MCQPKANEIDSQWLLAVVYKNSIIRFDVSMNNSDGIHAEKGCGQLMNNRSDGSHGKTLLSVGFIFMQAGIQELEAEADVTLVGEVTIIRDNMQTLQFCEF